MHRRNIARAVESLAAAGFLVVAAAAAVTAAPWPGHGPSAAGAAAGGPPASAPGKRVSKPVADAPLTGDQKIVHVLNRLGFGPRPGDVARVRAMGLDRYIALQLTPERIEDGRVETKLASLDALRAPTAELVRAYREQIRLGQELRRLRAGMAGGANADRAEPSAAAGGGTIAAAATTGGDEAAAATARRQEIWARLRTLRERPAASGAPTQLATAKVVRAVESERQLLEVLVDFWTNHFNIDVRKNACRVLKVADDRDVIRAHALGKFRDLLGASARSPAMLVYLDNAQSQAPLPPPSPRRAAPLRRMAGNGDPAAVQPPPRRGGINENYARELMELHTLGVDGGYTQKDVQEVARCFTGWGVVRETGAFQFSPRRHDDGPKTVLGRAIPAAGGPRDGEAVLDLLASHPATMRFVSRKLCQRFVSDDPPTALIDKCVATWKRTDGDLREVVRTIVTSTEFFGRAAYRQKIKSPFEYAVSSVRALGGDVDLSAAAARRPARGANAPARTLTGQIAAMGQPLFQHQAPTGYPEDSRKWVSSGALIARLNFALALTGKRLAGLDLPRIDRGDPGTATTRAEARVEALVATLLQGDVSASTRATLLKEAAADGSAAGGDRLVALVIGSPEFQRR
jgi:uncharacterized protein (DUF1800 family)